MATVEQFYAEAAQHQYAAAWGLTDANAQNELRGYYSFQYTFSPVRSITFHRAELVSGGSGNVATVALSTTSVQTNQTQQCSGTARTVRSGARWLLDGISISCS